MPIKILICGLLFFFAFQTVSAQSITDQFQAYIGIWEGEGWHEHTDHTNFFVQRCSILPKLDGQILLIEQYAHIKDEPDQLLFKELQIWQLENDSTIVSFTYRGQKAARESRLSIEDGKIINRRNDSIYFVSEIDENGKYIMKGYEKGTRFFEMTLIKKN